jgi:hypothetical protein
MTKRRYEVNVQAMALRTIVVRADSGREALALAAERIRSYAGPWTIDFPGGLDEHYTVEDDQGKLIGPDAQNGFEDEEDNPSPDLQ